MNYWFKYQKAFVGAFYSSQRPKDDLYRAQGYSQIQREQVSL